MSTLSNNNIVKSISPKSLFDDMTLFLLSSVSFNKGDLLYLDTTNHVIKPVAADADTAKLIGVSRVNVVSGKVLEAYTGLTAVDAASASEAAAGPVFGVEVMLTLNTGDSLNPGDLVYPIPSVNAQTVSASSNTGARTACGVYNGLAISGAAAGTQVVVMLGCPYLGGTINF